MTSWQRQMLAQLDEEGKELQICDLLMTLMLAQGLAGTERFTVLGRLYRIESDPDKNEVRIHPCDH